jgi:hypothetical protein
MHEYEREQVLNERTTVAAGKWGKKGKIYPQIHSSFKIQQTSIDFI